MATIFQKTTSLGLDNTLVLDSREALLYPFDLGNDWTEIRMGMFVSMTDSSSNNGKYNDEGVNNNSFKNAAYFGLKDSSLTFPSLVGTSFIGSSTRIGNNTTISNASNYLDFQGGSIRFLVNDQISTSNTNLPLYLGTSAIGTGASNFAGFFGFRIRYNESAKIISGSCFSTLNNYVTDTSTTQARVLIGQLPNETANITGYFTSNLTATGSAISRPSAAFVYFPFYLNKFRIHNICVERYS